MRLREIITIRRCYDSRNEYRWNIYCEGNLISEESVFRAMSPGIMIHRERICPCVLFYEECARREKKKKKNSRHPPFLWFSYPNNYDAGSTGTYLDAEISFATYGKYFPKTRKASPNPRRVWYHREQQKFCRPSRFIRAEEQYNLWYNILGVSMMIFVINSYTI